MKAIGVDCWVPTQEEQIEFQRRVAECESKNNPSLPKPHKYKVVAQEVLRERLRQLAERLKVEGYEPIHADENRFRVMAPDERVDELESLIRKLTFQIHPCRIGESFAQMRHEAVSEGTPIEKRAIWDENRWAKEPDFAEYRPARDELVVLAKHWYTEILENDYSFRMFGACGDGDEYARPNARLSRISELIGDEVVEKAIEEAEEDYRKTMDPITWEVFKHGSREQQRVYWDAIHSGERRDYQMKSKAIDNFCEELSLDESQKKLLKILSDVGPKEFSAAFTAALRWVLDSPGHRNELVGRLDEIRGFAFEEVEVGSQPSRLT